MWSSGLNESQARIKINGRNINNLRYADDTSLVAESVEKLNSLFMRVNEESEKAGLKLNIQKSNIMASSPITSWQIEGEKVKDFFGRGQGAPKSLWPVTEAMKLKDACSVKGKL